jgi:hypothetical protein
VSAVKIRVFLIIGFFVILCVINPSLTHSKLGDILEGVKNILPSGKLSEKEIIKGLKEALQIGTGNAVGRASQTDGYFKNPKIKIPLPEKIKKVENLLRTTGFGSKVDSFEWSMNRAAEQAAPEAKSLFWDAIKEMTFTDARDILNGQDDEATRYFQSKISDRLQGIFEPIVHKAMSKVGVTGAYQDLNDKLKSIPFARRSLHFDLDQYVTDRSLDGLFFLLSDEERKIRQDPEARVTDLLKKVFGRRK